MSGTRFDPVDVAVIIIHETDMAYKVKDGNSYQWLPKSQIMNFDDDGDSMAIITIPEWLAIEKGLV